MRRIRAVVYKEMLHILRDPRSLAVAVLMPLLMLLLYGYAIDMELHDLKIGILDEDHSPASRALIRELTSSRFILDSGRLESRGEIEPGFRRNRFRAALIIPPGYSKSLLRDPVTKVQILIDGADGSTASAVDTYLRAVIARVNRELARSSLGGEGPPIEARPRFLYNPQLVSSHFIVPGLVALILIMICTLLTSIAITREKETGTLEQVLTAPVRAREVVIGKVIPYLLIAAFDGLVILVVGHLVFGVPIRGPWWALAGYSLLYLLISLSFGLVISAFARTQQVALMMALMATLLPTLLLSGFIFSLSSMPFALQVISRLIPATYYIEALRGVMLVGDSWYPKDALVMTVMLVALMTVAIRGFQDRLK